MNGYGSCESKARWFVTIGPVGRAIAWMVSVSASLSIPSCDDTKPGANASCEDSVAKLCDLAWQCTTEQERQYRKFIEIFGESKDNCVDSLEAELCRRECPKPTVVSGEQAESCLKAAAVRDCSGFYSSQVENNCKDVCRITAEEEKWPDAEASVDGELWAEEADGYRDADQSKDMLDSPELAETWDRQDCQCPDIDRLETLDQDHVPDLAERQDSDNEGGEEEAAEPVFIRCVDKQCDMEQVCCLTAGEGDLVSSSCLERREDCTGQVALKCDNSMDCGAGKMCCASVDTQKLRARDGLYFDSNCFNNCEPPQNFSMCATSDDCQQGWTCCYPFYAAKTGTCLNNLLATFCQYKDEP